MTTINLRDGLEALYYFGENDFDPQRNQLQDHSGYGRHATANGSPTVGVNGPNDFEAANFSGGNSGDYFAVPSGFIDVDDFSISCLIKAPLSADGSGTSILNTDNVDSDHLQLRYTANGSIKFGIGESGVKFDVTSTQGYHDDEYHTITAVREGNEIRLYIDSNLVNSNSNSNIGSVSNNNPYIGAKRDGSKNFSGEMAFVMYHTRAVSYSEIERINDLTAPRRSQL
jgi:hypothetical protein